MVGSEVPAAAKYSPSLSPSILPHIQRHIGRGASALEGLIAHHLVSHVQAHHIITLHDVPHHLASHCKFTLNHLAWFGGT